MEKTQRSRGAKGSSDAALCQSSEDSIPSLWSDLQQTDGSLQISCSLSLALPSGLSYFFAECCQKVTLALAQSVGEVPECLHPARGHAQGLGV